MPRNLYVYILKCSDDSYYVGVTNNLERRLVEHNHGGSTNSYTFSRRPVSLLWSIIIQGPQQAIDLERRLKGWSRAKKEALINGDFDALPFLSRNKRVRESDGDC